MNTTFYANMAAIVLIIGCATGQTDKKKGHSSPDIVVNDVPEANASNEIVMIATGEKSPLLPDSGNTNWLQMSESSSSSKNRLYGLLATGQWEAAIEEARRGLELQPGDGNLILALGTAFGIGRNYEMAGYYGDLSLKLRPDNGDAMNLIGLRIMMGAGNRRGDFEDAITWFRKASDNDSAHIAALLNMGYLQLELGDAQSASESFVLASSRCGRCSPSQFAVGLASARSADWAKARTAFEGILSQDKSRADAQYQLALVHKNGLKDPGRAINLLQEIVSDGDGRFKDATNMKRVANITLRQMRSTDKDGAFPTEGKRETAPGASDE
jgi:tetratricopeptide (TPR) repeat protein